MRHASRHFRFVIPAANAALLAVLLALAACGSSGKTFTSPSAVSKCAVSFDTPGTPLPATGGSAAISVKTERECQWTAQPDAQSQWLTVTAGASGQGDGTVQFNAAANGDPVARNGGIMLNGLRAQVTQAAGECRYELAQPSTTLGQTGGTSRVDVRASSALCTWTASSDADWITITSGASGKGSAAVVFAVLPTTGPPRTATLTIAGLHFNVTQAEGCAYVIAPTTFAVGASGGSNVVTVTAGTGCPWTATSDATWISLASVTGTGNGTVGFTVAPTTGPARTGTMTIAGQVFTVSQSPGCSFAVAPLTHSADATGGTRTVTVDTTAGCTWTAASNDSWIALLSATSDSGPGVVSFAIAATGGPARTGTLTIAGQTVTVTQAPGCSFDVSPTAFSVDPDGGTRTLKVTAAPGCAWTAAVNNNVPWIRITGGASGSGSGTVTFTVASTNGPSRSGSLAVAGHTVTVTQSPGCNFDVSPLNINVDASGGRRTVDVKVAGGCAWEARSNTPAWITIVSGASDSGNGTVTFNVDATTGPSRSGTLTVAGETVTVTQGQGCTFSISPDSQNVPASGGSGAVSVTAPGGCNWDATPNVPWIKITSNPASGSGNRTINFTVDATTGPARTGTMTIAGRTFTVNQGQGCAFSLSATSASVPAGGRTGTFDVRTGDGCGWSAASSDTSWLTITGNASGTGNGTITYSASPNTGAQRSATITVNGQTFTVTQDGGCTYSISPPGQNVPSSGGNLSVTVTAPDGCGWSASTNAGWITFPSGNSGSGNGPLQLVIAPNSDVDRQGIVTIQGQTFTVTQASGCTVSIAPTGQGVPSTGGSGSFSVNATGTCAWNANAPSVPWIHITSPASGAGPGTIQFTVDLNTGGARSGTITVNGQTFTVNQDGGCNPTVAPDTIGEPAAGGSQIVNVTTSQDCSWSANSNNPEWIAVGAVSGPAGNGTVRLDIQANTGPPRSGTATVAGKIVTVNQDSGCSITLSATSQQMPAEGGPGTVMVNTSGGCTWTAVPNASWIRVVNGASGSGGGNVDFTVDPNPDHDPRTGTITIGNQVLTIIQDRQHS
jgi:hypothetical protein